MVERPRTVRPFGSSRQSAADSTLKFNALTKQTGELNATESVLLTFKLQIPQRAPEPVLPAVEPSMLTGCHPVKVYRYSN